MFFRAVAADALSVGARDFEFVLARVLQKKGGGHRTRLPARAVIPPPNLQTAFHRNWMCVECQAIITFTYLI